MMKLILFLEKSKSFWFLIFLLPVFFLLRLPSVIEPYWYGDEGIYQVMGQAIHDGRILYSGIWDNKPPLLYLLYALFNGDQQTIRFFSLCIGALTTLSFFFLAKKLFRKLRPAIASTIFFTLFFATPIIEGNIANAENFMLLPIILAGLLIYTVAQRTKPLLLNSNRLLLMAGLLLGIAFLFKIIAVFDLAAFFLFYLFANLPEKLSLSLIKTKPFHSFLRDICLLILGFLAPLGITALYFLCNNAFADFIRATFFGNIGYVGYGNTFLHIPQGFLVLKLLLLTITVGVIFLRRKHFPRSTLFIALWLAFSLFNAFFSQRPYTHYVLVLLPSFCLLAGLIIATQKPILKVSLLSLLLIAVFIVSESFWMYGLKKTFLYYQNAVLFVTGQKSVTNYQTFFDRKTPRDYEVASFIKKHTTPTDNVFIWGDSAQIYALSHKLPPNKYTVAYHIRQNEDALLDTQNAINLVKPKYIITLTEAPLLPFKLPFYTMRFALQKATIYEREF